MKAFEAISILESLDPNLEVTLTIGTSKKRESEPQVPAVFGRRFEPKVVGDAYLPGQYNPSWVIGTEFWPQRKEITCKLH